MLRGGSDEGPDWEAVGGSRAETEAVGLMVGWPHWPLGFSWDPRTGVGRGGRAPVPTGASAERTLAHEALGDLCWGDDDHWPSAPARLWERSTGDVWRALGLPCTLSWLPFLLKPPPPALPRSRENRHLRAGLCPTWHRSRVGWVGNLLDPGRK